MRAKLSPLIFLTLLLVGPAFAAEEPGAPAKVHDHVAFVFRRPEGTLSAARRASDASANLNAVIDERIAGNVQVLVGIGSAAVRVGPRQLFRLFDEDATAAGFKDLSEYAPQVQAELDDFLTKERRRASLQRTVLSVSLVVFFGLLAYLLVRLVYRSTRGWEARLIKGDLNSRWIRLSSERWRGLVLFLLAGARLLVSLSIAYVFLLVSLSLFERTEAWRNQVASWVTTPLSALLERFLRGVPNVVLLVLLFAVLRGGWQALSVAFDRAAVSDGKNVLGVRQSTIVPMRLLARAVLIVAALLLIPLVTGYEGDVFTRLGFLLLGGVALALVPLIANVTVGTYFLIRQEYALGEWLLLRLPGGKEVSGEVTLVDFLHLRLVPQEGGEIRVPHLSALWSPVVHLPSTRALVLEIEVPLATLAPEEALLQLKSAADAALTAHELSANADVELLHVTPERARFQVRSSGTADSHRTSLLLALSAAVRPPPPPSPPLAPSAEPPAKESAESRTP